MRSNSRTRFAVALGLFALGSSSCSDAQQEADSSFEVSVERPAYVTSHPRVLIDQAHQNFHTMSGRYAPFARLLANDGYRVTAQRDTFRSAPPPQH